MIRRQRTTQTIFLVVSDLVATTSALGLAFWLRFGWQIIPPKEAPAELPGLSTYLPLLPISLLLMSTVFAIFGLYRLRRTNARAESYMRAAVALTLTFALLIALLSLYRPTQTVVTLDGTVRVVAQFPFSRLVLGLFYGLSLVGVLGGRILVQSAFDRLRRSGRNLKRIVIAGAGPLARTVIDKIRLHEEFGFRIVGLLGTDAENDSYRDVPVLGTLQQAPAMIQQHDVDQLYVALPLSAHEEILQLLHDIRNEMVEVKVVPDLLQYIALRAGLEDLDGVPIVNLSGVSLAGVGSVVKRSIDLLSSTACLLLFAPMLPLIALAVRVTSRGPIFYRQTRMGLDGRPFNLLKFRSMVVNAESETGPVWADREDPRCTPVGAFLRKYSLDELPQFWNVFRGDMSLVGPRPERPFFVEEFRHRIPHYMLRHRVRSGMTGWAQVHGWRGNTSLEKRIEYDLYYVEHWSIALDLKILWMTVSNGNVHEHAH